MALTHFDGDGHAHMIDVSDKAITSRIATAENYIQMQPETFDRSDGCGDGGADRSLGRGAHGL